MKFPRLFLSLCLATSAAMLAGAPPPDAKLTAPARKEAPSLSDKGRSSSTPPPPITDDPSRRGIEDSVEILSVKEQKPEADGRRKVIVHVRYALVHYPKGALTLGFNLKSATKFVAVATQTVMAGVEEMDLSATIVPVEWPKDQPFKLNVSLTAEPHPKQTSLLAVVAQPMKPAAVPAASH